MVDISVDIYMKMSDIELKDCPFCGGKAFWMIPTKEAIAHSLGISSPGTMHHIECEMCGSRSAYYADKNDAHMEWNRRIGKS